MIPTYSVIIHNKATAESFARHLPLFTQAINDNRIGICKWVESGTTIDTALPQLRELTDDKEEWNAVIVRFEDDDQMAGFASAPANPFDFLINSAPEPAVCESEVPLIRLTHMLGGVPKPETVFKPTQTTDKAGRPVISYIPVDNQKQLLAHRQLSEKYEFNGRLPTSIRIISVRNRASVKDEPQSGDRASKFNEFFWKRNRYPSNCRFLVYDFSREGPVQKMAEEFNFWLSTLLISINEIDTSTLQAYKLYKFNTKLNTSALHKSLQAFSDRLAYAHKKTETAIREEQQKKLSGASSIPLYRCDIPVDVREERFAKKAFNETRFGLLSPSAHAEISRWNKTASEEAGKLRAYEKSADRTLNQTAHRMKGSCTFAPEDVYSLDPYTEQDMRSETDLLRNTIIRMQGELPAQEGEDRAKITQAENDVRQFLMRRIQRGPAIGLFFLVAGLLVLCSIPAIVQAFEQNGNVLFGLLAVFAAELLLVALFGLVIVLRRKLDLNKLLKKYTQLIIPAYARISEGLRMFSGYLSNIASYAKGCSFLHDASRMQTENLSMNKLQTAHLHSIATGRTKLQTWATAFHYKLSPLAADALMHVNIDYGVSPSQNLLYAFDADATLTIPVNDSGDRIVCPFSFAEKLEIEKEDL